MKRLSAQIGIVYFSALTVAFYSSDLFTAIVCVASLILGIILIAVPSMRARIVPPVLALTVFAACFINLAFTHFCVTPIMNDYSYTEHGIEAVSVDEPSSVNDGYRYYLRTVSVDGERKSMNLLYYSSVLLDAQIDDTLYFTSELRPVENQSLAARNYLLYADDSESYAQIEPASSHGVKYHAIRLKNKLREAFDSYLTKDSAALCKALLLGDKYAIDSSIRYDFVKAGVSYFIVVSGMHFSVLCLFVMALFRHFRKRWLTLTANTLFIVLYCLITGLQSSVLRASIMMIMLVIGRSIRRVPYSLNHLGIAGLVMPMILSPYCTGDGGLLLSFYSTLAILLWATPIAEKLCFTNEYGDIYKLRFTGFLSVRVSQFREYLYAWRHHDLSSYKKYRKMEKEVNRKKRPPIKERRSLFFKKVYNVFAGIVSVSLAANIFTIPLTVALFREFSTLTMITSTLLYFFIYFILLLALITSVLFAVGLLFLSVLVSWPLEMMCQVVLRSIKMFASLPIAFIKVNNISFFIWLVISLSAVMILSAMRNRRRNIKIAVFISLITLVAGMVFYGLDTMNTFDLKVYDCNEGVCAAIEKSGKLYLLSMDAKSKDVREAMERISSEYDTAEIALCDSDHRIGTYSLRDDNGFAISDYLLYDRYESGRNGNIVSFCDGDVIILDDDLTLTAVMNNDSLITYITAGNRAILLLPDDAESEDIPDDMLDPDIVIMSSYFDGADNIRCDDLIISDTRNKALLTAKELYGGFNNVYFTYGCDITYDLR